jgi:uncharacterized protein (DUF58 family)
MRGWLALIASGAIGTIGLATRNPLAETLAIALLALVGLSLSYRLLTGSVQGERKVAATVIPWGGALSESITFFNVSRLRVPSLRVTDYSALPQHPRGYVGSVPGRRSLTWDVATPCRTRGRYQLGPIEMTTGDPFGLFTVERTIPNGESVLVLPRWVQLTRCALALDGALPGDLHGRRHGESPPAIAGVRAYTPGDPVARIHWHASARAGTLMTKQFDPETETTLWLALDLDTALPAAQEELLVTVATSLAMYGLQQANMNVGLIVSGSYPVTLAAERDSAQRRRIQEALAEVHAGTPAAIRRRGARIGGVGTLAELVAARGHEIAARHTLILVTARGTRQWETWLSHLRQRGVAARVVAVVPDGIRGTNSPSQSTVDQPGWSVPVVPVPARCADPLEEETLIAILEIGGAS